MWVAKPDRHTPKLRFWYTVCNFYANVLSVWVSNILVGKNILSGTRHETSRSDTGLLTKTGFESSAEPCPDLHKNRYFFTILTIRVVCKAWTICTARVQLSYSLYSPCRKVEQSLPPVYNACTICLVRVQCLNNLYSSCTVPFRKYSTICFLVFICVSRRNE